MFLYGMDIMGDGLRKLSGGKLESILERMTSRPMLGVLSGAFVTAIIQSSAATTVMVVGFVNSGIMNLGQAAGVIMGANIGTTVTAWILSLTGLQGSSFILKMLKPTSFTPILALIGILFLMFSKRGRKKDVGTILLGFAVLMFGMNAMTSAVAPLANEPKFAEILAMFQNPVLGVLAGAVLSAAMQSSSASVGVMQAMSATGSLTFGAAIPMILGQNIGTCSTALISCIGASKNAKRAAMVHLFFNLIGTIVFLILFYVVHAIVKFPFFNDSLTSFNIAVIHTLFNVITTAILLPFNKLLCKLASAVVRDKKGTEDKTPFIDERFLRTPSFALERCHATTLQMAEISRATLTDAITIMRKYDDGMANMIIEAESLVDQYEDKIGSYLVKLSGNNLSLHDSKEVSVLLHTIGDLERISDHAVNVMEVAREMEEKHIRFSDSARIDLEIMASAVMEILNTTIDAFENNDVEMAAKVEPLEEVIDELKADLRMRHVERLQQGACTIELGFVFSDLVTNYERVSDHCSNIAVMLMQMRGDSFDSHEYISNIKITDSNMYQSNYAEYKARYALPKN